jgi:hypothetical protein
MSRFARGEPALRRSSSARAGQWTISKCRWNGSRSRLASACSTAKQTLHDPDHLRETLHHLARISKLLEAAGAAAEGLRSMLAAV